MRGWRNPDHLAGSYTQLGSRRSKIIFLSIFFMLSLPFSRGRQDFRDLLLSIIETFLYSIKRLVEPVSHSPMLSLPPSYQSAVCPSFQASLAADSASLTQYRSVAGCDIVSEGFAWIFSGSSKSRWKTRGIWIKARQTGWSAIRVLARFWGCTGKVLMAMLRLSTA